MMKIHLLNLVFCKQQKNSQDFIKAAEYVDGYIEGKEVEVDCSKKYIYLKVNVNYLTRAFILSYDGEEYQHVDTLTNVYYLWG